MSKKNILSRSKRAKADELALQGKLQEQPVYQRAKYRWRRYEKDFEPVMAVLRPYIEHFGYTD